MPRHSHDVLLVSLPLELLEFIISYIDSPQTVASLNQTCKLLQQLTEDKLYTTVRVYNGKVRAFALAFSSRPDRKDRVREVHVDCEIPNPTCDLPQQYFSACEFVHVYSEFKHLEVLSLKSGYYSRLEDSDEEGFGKWKVGQDKLASLFAEASLAMPVVDRTWPKLRYCELLLNPLNIQ
jgi:hypothetical protein